MLCTWKIAADFSGVEIRDKAQYNDNVQVSTALGRISQPDDIGGDVAFLCSYEAPYIISQRVEISGGMTLYIFR